LFPLVGRRIMVGMAPNHQPPTTNTDHDEVSERLTATHCSRPTADHGMGQETKITLTSALVADDDIVFEPVRLQDLPRSIRL
jgi:hypothetical protein